MGLHGWVFLGRKLEWIYPIPPMTYVIIWYSWHGFCMFLYITDTPWDFSACRTSEQLECWDLGPQDIKARAASLESQLQKARRRVPGDIETSREKPWTDFFKKSRKLVISCYNILHSLCIKKPLSHWDDYRHRNIYRNIVHVCNIIQLPSSPGRYQA